uniref:DNA binding protein hu-like protein n=1 Tax=Rhodomonas salina TaxID=3034 RepID=A6MVZ9_RHDSA|nr:DNA binding protein hu-like protein [Rhodomonas salina]ABO70763.1 DNA binding protein hu-like protein [Rhodomonas salina]
MNKKDLVEIVAKKRNLTKKESEEIITTILETIIKTVSEGEKVTLVGFGSFEARERQAREGRNPKTGERLQIPASRVPTFSVGKFFKDKVSNT